MRIAPREVKHFREVRLASDLTSAIASKRRVELQKATYLELAVRAERSGFTSIAEQWRRLANELELNLGQEN